MTIAAAIAQSIATDSIVRVEVDDLNDAREELKTLADGVLACSVNWESPEPGRLDVWGWTSDTTENEQDWRLSVVLS